MSLLSHGNSPEDLFSFAGSVGRFGDNNREDVIKAQALLANAGYYDLPEPRHADRLARRRTQPRPDPLPEGPWAGAGRHSVAARSFRRDRDWRR